MESDSRKTAARPNRDHIAEALGIEPDEIGWTPHPGKDGAPLSSQGLFLTANIREVLYQGTRGPGKTESLLMCYAQHVDRGFGSWWNGIIFREEYKELDDIINKSERLFPILFPRARFKASKGDYKWVFPGGEQLAFRAASKASDYRQYHGQEIPFQGYEELTNQKDGDFYLAMDSCCRCSFPGVPRMRRATTNSFGPGFLWVKDRWIDQAPPGVTIREEFENPLTGEIMVLERMHIFGHWSENTALLENDPNYIAALMADTNEDRKAAWMDGSWEIAIGAMLGKQFDRAVHVLEPFELPPEWKIFRSFDYGWSAPFSIGWWAISDGSDVQLKDGTWRSTVRGDMFRVREWYGYTGKPNEGVRMLAKNITKGIIEREMTWGIYGRVYAGPADNQIFNDEQGLCIADEMAKPVRIKAKMYKGVRWKRSNKKPGSRKQGRENIMERLDNAKHHGGRPREKPGMYIFDWCRQWIRIMPTLPKDEKDPDDVERKSENHVWDENRYAIDFADSFKVGGSQTSGYY